MIYLMRHGQDDEDYIGGWSDVDLIPEGIKDVEDTSLWIKNNLNIKRIICSNVKRAKHTADIVNSYLNVSIIYSDSLREQNKGVYNGKLRLSLSKEEKNFIKSVDINTIYPQGESLKNLYDRIKSYLDELLSLEDDVLLITHRGVINMIYYIFNNLDLDMNKKQFCVTTASLHEVDKVNKTIKRIK